jgi:hypothetical protein
VRIAVCHSEIRVADHLFYILEVSPSKDEIRAERMSEVMEVEAVDPPFLMKAPDSQINSLSLKSSRVAVLCPRRS